MREDLMKTLGHTALKLTLLQAVLSGCGGVDAPGYQRDRSDEVKAPSVTGQDGQNMPPPSSGKEEAEDRGDANSSTGSEAKAGDNAAILGQGLEQSFYCAAGDKGYYLSLKSASLMQVSERVEQGQGEQMEGRYEFNGSQITLTLEEIGFQETSGEVESVNGFVVTFQTPSLKCHATGHNRAGAHAEAYFKCPSINYIPSVTYHDNAFQFYSDGSVKRRRWRELLQVPDTLYQETWGIYVITGSKVWMAFGDRKEERFLNATIGNGEQELLVAELEPEKGACKLN